MPYIQKADRERVDANLAWLFDRIDSFPDSDRDGVLNYIFTRLLKHVYPLKYHYINRAVGVLECAKLEYYRALAGPYEDAKRQENGDV